MRSGFQNHYEMLNAQGNDKEKAFKEALAQLNNDERDIIQQWVDIIGELIQVTKGTCEDISKISVKTELDCFIKDLSDLNVEKIKQLKEKILSWVHESLDNPEAKDKISAYFIKKFDEIDMLIKSLSD